MLYFQYYIRSKWVIAKCLSNELSFSAEKIVKGYKRQLEGGI
jgi:hypothetical protein